jgi:L-serine dehydratase
MESITSIFKTGMGPSSSHTMGPNKAAKIFKNSYPGAAKWRVDLYGSLAATGKGHLTDKAILSALGENAEIIWHPDETLPLHPNGMRFTALDAKGEKTGDWEAYSVGGGDVRDASDIGVESATVYPQNTMKEILEHTSSRGITLWEYVREYEGPHVWDYLRGTWADMTSTLKHGLENEGLLPGPLKLQRKAVAYHIKAQNSAEFLRRMNLVFSYALACAEENACGEQVVTAPTCGSCGVLPSVLYFLQTHYKFSDELIAHALGTAGLIGNLARKNASISGAEVGCQGEVGVACAMAAGAATQLLGGTPPQCEYATEMGLEHHLGLTCDPVAGLVQIPCIERNAMAAARAMDCAAYALFSDGRHRISYDEVLATMKATGRDMNNKYRETSRGGLASTFGPRLAKNP